MSHARFVFITRLNLLIYYNDRQIAQILQAKAFRLEHYRFLDECKVEPFDRKIYQYLRCLNSIADCEQEQNERQEKAKLLLRRYKEEVKPIFWPEKPIKGEMMSALKDRGIVTVLSVW